MPQLLKSKKTFENLKIERWIIFTLFILSLFVFAYRIGNLDKLCFDENHYIPAAREWLQWAPTRNLEHPPLGKLFMTLSLKNFGDNPFGWRFPSLMAGVISIIFIYGISLLLFKNKIISFLSALFSIFNFLFYVQARIGMLDGMMVAFLLGGTFFWLATYSFHEVLISKVNRRICFALSAISWGLALAIKWPAVFVFFPLIVVSFILEINRYFKPKSVFISAGKMMLFFGILFLTYFSTFIPYLFVTGPYRIGIYDIVFKLPFKMLELQKSVVGTHPYASEWMSWIAMARPIWYEFIQQPSSDIFRGVVLLGNPVTMAVGLLALGLTFLLWPRLQSKSKVIAFIFLASWLTYPLSPRKVSFFYYFYPSAAIYSILVPQVILELFSKQDRTKFQYTAWCMGTLVVLSIIFFDHYYPILSGGAASMKDFPKWLWFKSWI